MVAAALWTLHGEDNRRRLLPKLTVASLGRRCGIGVGQRRIRKVISIILSNKHLSNACLCYKRDTSIVYDRTSLCTLLVPYKNCNEI